jgi:uncharacterized protein (DUF2236 family)
VLNERCGYFTPDDAIWKIGSESILMAGGGRALLAQAAHPLVAAGIVRHSRYREEPWVRLGRTMGGLYTIVFGTRAEADEVGRRVRAVHRRVRGQVDGTPYSALDSELMLWVHATLVETAFTMYRTFVGSLDRADEEAFHADMKVVAEVFGVPRQILPETLDDFWTYWHGMLSGDELAIGADARAVADTVLDPPLPGPLRALAPFARLVTTATLAPELRERYGISHDSRADVRLARTAAAVRRGVLPLVPARLRLLATTRGHRGVPFRVLDALAS